MDFGVFDHVDRNELPLREFYDTRLKIIEAYDRCGFHGYHMAEHHSTPLGMAPSPTVFMSAIAQRTQRLRFGPMVFALPFYSPLRLIEEICMLDQMSGGRVEMGFGRGASPIEMSYHGISFENSERMYREGVEVVKRGLTSKTLTFEGEFYKYTDVPMEITPFQQPHPPLWYGSSSASSAERAAAQAINIMNLDAPDRAKIVIDAYRAAWQRENNGLPLPKLGVSRFIVVAATDEAALSAARRAYPMWHRSFSWLYHIHGRSPMRGERAKDFDSLEREGKGVAGSPDKVARYLERQIEETGTNYLVGQFAFGDLTLDEVTSSIDLFARHVMPQLRAQSVAPTPVASAS